MLRRFILTFFFLANLNCSNSLESIQQAAVTESQEELQASTTLNILTPLNGSTLSGSTNVTASVRSNKNPISLQWQMDGQNLGNPQTLSPYQVILNTALLQNGEHQLTATVTDAKNNTISQSVTFTVNNMVAPPTDTTVSDIGYSPVLIPYSAPEIVNPFRGLYRWRGSEIYALNAPAPDVYERYTWRNIETSRDVYNFSALDAAIAAAAANGAKFGFRIRSMVSYGDNTMHVPDYMASYGWWADSNRDGAVDTYLPDWNHAFYLDRANRLLQALGRRYGDDPRVSWVDIGLYGQYGEWTISTSSVDYSRAPAGVLAITAATKRALIDAHVSAFPRKQLLMFMLYSNFEAILYAYGLPTEKPIGARVDCLGRPGFFTQWTNRPDVWNQIRDRWRVAPLITEYCSSGIELDNPNSTDDALGQVETFHVSMIGNGNMNWNALSSTDQNNYVNVAKRSGYRLSFTEFKLPNIIYRDRATSLVTSWINQGVAPVYETWSVMVELRDPQSRTRVFQQTLNIPLKSLMPATAPTMYTDTLRVPASVPAGAYEVVLKVVDPTGYRRNMHLANQGISAQLDYLIGTLQLR